MLNRQTVIGRLTRDPEVKEVTVRGEKTWVANFSVASDEDRGQGTDYVNVVCWRQLAENVGKYLTKGRLVYVEGRPKTRSYPVKKDGVEFQNYVTEINADRVDFLDKADGTQKDTPVAATAGGYQGGDGSDDEPF